LRLPLCLPRFRLATALCLALVLALPLGATGCGGGGNSDSGSFSADYNKAIAKLDRASQALVGTRAGGKQHSSRAISRQLNRFAGLLAETAKDLHGLTPPKAAAGEYAKLTGALDRSIAAARRAARAARQIQPKRQRAALRDLRNDVAELARAQTALQRAIDTG
jgi:sugar diacid utilization regulator